VTLSRQETSDRADLTAIEKARKESTPIEEFLREMAGTLRHRSRHGPVVFRLCQFGTQIDERAGDDERGLDCI
jgi:hypothetical protein